MSNVLAFPAVSGASQKLGCRLGDFLVEEGYTLRWEVKGVNTLNGDLYLENKGYRTVTMKTAHLWEKYGGVEAAGKGGL